MRSLWLGNHKAEPSNLQGKNNKRLRIRETERMASGQKAPGKPESTDEKCAMP